MTSNNANPSRTFRMWLSLGAMLVSAHVQAADQVVLPTADDFSVPRIIERLAKRIEPDLVGKPERLPQYIDFFRSELGNDSRLFAFNVNAKRADDGRVELQGDVEFPETRASLNKFLTALHFKLDDHLETLPATSLGKEIFGLVKSAHTICYDRPAGRQRPENDCLIGEPLYLLREENGHYLAHSGEGYLGFVPTKDVLRVDATRFANYLAGRRVRIKSDQKVGEITIPAAASLKLLDTNGQQVTVELPTRKHIQLAAGACDLERDRTSEIESIIANGKQLLGTDYLWGGKTTSGVDCSGLVQLSYTAAGIRLPRDAYQQFYVGRLTATRWHTAGMRRGDTLYFLGPDGKIRHTALYLGDNHYLQAVEPVVRISSFNPADPDYDAKRHEHFAFAKRPLE